MKAQTQAKPVRIICPLYYLANVLAVIPSINDITKRKVKKYWNKIYIVALFFLMLLSISIAIYNRFNSLHLTEKSPSLIATDLFITLSAFFVNVSTILSSLWHLEKFEMFFSAFSKVNPLVTDNYLGIKKAKSFNTCLILGHFTFILFEICDYLADLSAYCYLTYRCVQYYHMYITTVHICYFALLLNDKFEEINNNLVIINNILLINKGNITVLQTTSKDEKFFENIKQLSWMYKLQTGQVNLFNKIFGWRILLLTLNVIAELVDSLNIVTVNILADKEEEEGEPDASLDFVVMANNILWPLWQVALITSVIVCCRTTQDTAKETADICFEMLLKLPKSSSNAEENALQSALNLLNQMALHRHPSFSAAGFFLLDYNVLLAILGSVTSYLIVLIPFNT